MMLVNWNEQQARMYVCPGSDGCDRVMSLANYVGKNYGEPVQCIAGGWGYMK